MCAKPYISFLRCFLRFFSASMRMNGFITCLVHVFFKTLKHSCYCGSRRHLRGRTALQADTDWIPCCPGALPSVTHSTAFQAKILSSSLRLFDSSSLRLFNSSSLPLFLSLSFSLLVSLTLPLLVFSSFRLFVSSSFGLFVSSSLSLFVF